MTSKTDVIETLKSKIKRMKFCEFGDNFIQASLISEGWPRGAVDEAMAGKKKEWGEDYGD